MNTKPFVLAGMLWAVGPALADFTGVVVEEYAGGPHEQDWIDHGHLGLKTYRVYAQFDLTGDDGVLAVFGDIGRPASMSSTEASFYNDDFFGGLIAPRDFRPAGIWSAEWDTYVTIGLSHSPPDTNLSPGFATETNNLASDWTSERVDWFVTPNDPQSIADPATGRVLLAQMTVGEDEHVAGTMNLLLRGGTQQRASFETDSCPCPSILFVDASAAGGRCGRHWYDAFQDVQSALQAARACGGSIREIRVAAGEYTPAPPDGDRTVSFDLLEGVSIYGGFPPGGGEFEQRNPDLYETILSGDLNGDDQGFANNGENSYHVVTATGPDVDASTILDGFTIKGGNANGNDPYYSAGGIYISGANPTVRACRIEANKSTNDAGGVLILDGSPGFVDCKLVGNLTDGPAGGVNFGNSASRFDNCTIAYNTAQRGGGFSDWLDSQHQLVNCLVVGNTGIDYGGAFLSISRPVMTNCTVAMNDAPSDPGIWIGGQADTVTMTNCVVWGNGNGEDQIVLHNGTPPSRLTIDYSCVQEWMGEFGGVGNIGADPLFVDAGAGDYRVRLGSPVIDAADNEAVPADEFDLDGDGDVTEPVPVDLDGSARFFDDRATDDSGNGDPPIVDMGAYELQFCPIRLTGQERTVRAVGAIYFIGGGVYDWETAAAVGFEPFSAEVFASAGSGDGEGSASQQSEIDTSGFVASGTLSAKARAGDTCGMMNQYSTFGQGQAYVEVTIESVVDFDMVVLFEVSGGPTAKATLSGPAGTIEYESGVERSDVLEPGTYVFTMDADVEAEAFCPGGPYYVFAEAGYAVSAQVSSCLPCVGDLNGDDHVGFADILAILAAWGNAGGSEDLDGSGTVDFADILVVLSAWGPCE